MAVAGCRFPHGKSPFLGDSVGLNPADRGKAGSKRASWQTPEGH